HERLQQNTIPDSGFSGYILNIKNERKYPPVASRDNLKQDSFDRLEKVIRADLEKFYSKIDVRTIAEYNASSQKYFIENLPSGGFQDVMPQSTINFNKLLGVRVFTFVNKPKEEDEHNYAHSDLNKFFEKNVQILCNYNKTMKRINKVIEHSSNIVVAVPDGNKHDRHSSLWIMEQAGIQSVSDYMKAKNIKVPRNGKLGDVAVRFGGFRINIEQMDLDDLTSNCIRIPKEQLIESSIREFSEYLTSDELELKVLIVISFIFVPLLMWGMQGGIQVLTQVAITSDSEGEILYITNEDLSFPNVTLLENYSLPFDFDDKTKDTNVTSLNLGEFLVASVKNEVTKVESSSLFGMTIIDDLSYNEVLNLTQKGDVKYWLRIKSGFASNYEDLGGTIDLELQYLTSGILGPTLIQAGIAQILVQPPFTIVEKFTGLETKAIAIEGDTGSGTGFG
ncbi:hypothetical protein LCGC14_2654430, partial [marine sediment metagenome]